MNGTDARLAGALRNLARPLHENPFDYDDLVDLAAGARVVLIGAASHGTHEFYRERAVITRRLIEEQGLGAVAAEADWPDAYRVNLFVRGVSDDAGPVEALSNFARFPAWMWRNTDVVDFVRWLRVHNDAQPEGSRAGFCGLDLHSLYSSIQAVLAYLDRIDPDAARRAGYRFWRVTGENTYGDNRNSERTLAGVLRSFQPAA